MVTVIQKAERLPNGRVKGVAPAQLWPRVLRYLTADNLAQIASIEAEAIEVRRKKARLLVSLGLDPRGTYRFTPKGEVIEVGKHSPRY